MVSSVSEYAAAKDSAAKHAKAKDHAVERGVTDHAVAKDRMVKRSLSAPLLEGRDRLEHRIGAHHGQ